MPVVLYLIGALTTVAGLFALGFSIPNRGFDVANALIGAGATAAVGGLILIGLGATVREVRRLARAVQERAPAEGSRADAAKPARSSRVTGPIPVPARPVAPEPAAEEPAASGARPSIFAVVRGGGTTEHFEIDETENVPLSPRAPERAPEPEYTERAPEPRADARSASPSAIASRAAARLDLPRTIPPEPASEPPAAPAERPHRNLFDNVWPNEQRRNEPAAPPPRAPSRRPAPSDRPMFAPPEPEAPADPFDLHAAVKEAVESIVPERREARPEPKLNLRAAPPPPEPKADTRGNDANVAILKSGVIDGMAYTLYTDGSIEAELPDGMMRFASIDDLRAYLERNT